MIGKKAAFMAIAIYAALGGPTAAEDLTVFAAASLTNALDEVAAGWSEKTGHTVTISYAASSALARQIEAGAPADIFMSASGEWMDALDDAGDLAKGTRRDILGNTLVLIAHGKDAEPVAIDADLDLAGLLGDERLAMALIDSVPAGIYGRQALASLGLWDEVEPLVAQAENVCAALAFVARNEAPFGIVYATDAAVQDNVTIVGTFPPGSHDPITYPAAITAESESDVAADFLDTLTSPEARAIWQAHGFTVAD